jgi:hypothetical protein
MRRLWPVALLVLLGAGLGGRASFAQPGEAFLPDLRTLDPSDFEVRVQEGELRLLLTNTVWNGGDGPLEMRPEHDEEAGVTNAFQLLFTEDEQGNLVQLPEEHPAGSFEFHENHDHWHFQDLARYRLVAMEADGSRGEEVASSDKIGFCMFDQMQVDPTLPNAAPDPRYSGFACDQNTNVGYSVSWGDEYAYNFADQNIVIDGVPMGRYWVVSNADPEKLIEETNDHNNEAQTAIELRMAKGQVEARRITETTGSVCAPCGTSKLERGKRYAFKGVTDPSPGPRPTYPTPTIALSFKRPGADGWKAFGSAGSARAFTLKEPSDGSIAFDGSWGRDFVAHRSGAWVVRARYRGNENFTGSAVKVKVEVT